MTMAASVQFRPQNRNLGMVMREVDENLAIFMGMRNMEKKETGHPIEDSDEYDESTEPKYDGDSELGRLELEIVQSEANNDNFLNLEIDRNDHDWPYSQPDSTFHPSTELEGASNLTEITTGEGISMKPEPDSSNSTNCVAFENRKPLSSADQKKTTRAATATGGTSALPTKSKSSRASTPTPKPTLILSKPTSGQSRSCTPVRAMPRSSTPVGRPLIPVSSKSAGRSTTPTCIPATFSLNSSGSMKKMGSTNGKSLGYKPSNPSVFLSLSHDASENPKTLMPKRTISASRGRPSGRTSSFSSSSGKRRQKSCSPAKVRAPIISADHKYGNMIQSRSRGHRDGDDDVNPVLIGSKMVERVVNMRKLAPPKKDPHSSNESTKKCSHENSGFGLSLSKKSLDMAIRHMDIRQTTPDGLRTIATRVLSSVSARYIAAPGTESPLTSSSDSSKSGMYVRSRLLDGTDRGQCIR